VGQRLRVLILLFVLAGVGIMLGSSLAQWWRAAPEAEPSPWGPLISGRVKIQVLNGGGLPGVAWEATRALRDLGFDVVSYGNAGTFSQDSSVVMDRVGDLDTARLVAEAMGIQRVRSQPDSTLLVDVTVMLGPEWALPQEPVGEEESAPWWDIRRFFRGGDSAAAEISRN
jgi:hypothetical protein